MLRAGDAHPAQAAALVAFHNLDFIKQNLASSIHGAGASFPTYQCYWVLSVMDYYQFTGETAVLVTYADKIASLLGPLFLRTIPLQRGQPGLGFVGWDDRTGAGFSNSSCVVSAWVGPSNRTTLRNASGPQQQRLIPSCLDVVARLYSMRLS